MCEALSNTTLAPGPTLVVDGAAEVMGTRFPPGEYAPPPCEGHLLSLHRFGSRRRAWWLDGRALEGTARTHDVAVVPAGRPFAFAVGETFETLNVALRKTFLGRVAEEAGADPDRLEVLGRFLVRDPQVERLMLSFLSELETEGLGGRLYAEGLVQALAVHVLREHSSLGRAAKRGVGLEPGEGGLPKRALKNVTDYVGDNLSADLSLADMARAASVSPYHFSRLFKESTGLSPHRYVIRERVERAKGLLSATDMPVGEVARACGFSHQSHLARHTRRLLGVAPSDLRR